MSDLDLPGTLSLPFVEELYVRYLRDPSSVGSDWQAYFARLTPPSSTNGAAVRLGPSFRPPGLFRAGAGPVAGGEDFETITLQDKIVRLVREYRVRGHLRAQLDPLGLGRPVQPDLEPSFYGITEADLDRVVHSSALHFDGPMRLRDLVARLEWAYCRHIGVQFMHIDDVGMRRWLERMLERDDQQVRLGRTEQLKILRKLTEAVTLEEFIQKSYPGAKSFSLEGAESLIPLLATAIDQAVDHGVQEVVIGMPHRGRLNVLVNILQKAAGQVFQEFDDRAPEHLVGKGDVKYHLGYSSEWHTPAGNRAHLTLCFNPSHLEFVGPVALGRCRAKQDRIGDRERRKVMTILIHGDAAFAAEGIVQETLNLSDLGAYRTGGTLHVVVNNQIGFTTSPDEGRSTTYATDVAKMLQVPIFHVNGEDPEATCQAVHVAMAFRRTFGKDVVIDLYGYRRWGHNEGDEPAFTQPLLYRAIRARKSTRDGYLDHLLSLGGVTREEADRIRAECRETLEAELHRSREGGERLVPWTALQGVWRGYTGGLEAETPDVDTAVARDRLERLAQALSSVPEGFNPHPKIVRLLRQRAEMGRGERPLDWGMAEMLAYASLVTEGRRVRMTGQDCERGTFSHRHAILHDVDDGSTWCALDHLEPNQARAEIRNSPLSEAGVLGFEYGYSLDCPDGLVMWEAQFGDFSNCAQVIIDQFLSSGEDKWQRLSGLVMLLPHGFEGMGPEHSSARIERFLDLCAEDNMQVAQPTTPAQFFHLLRRQVVRPWRKPLVCLTPKSLLRHKEATSSLDELAAGRFARVLPDAGAGEEVSRILLCSGKVFYELRHQRTQLERRDVAIVRLEQLYPFPFEELAAALAPYADGTPVVWVQDEPENMGAWRYLRNLFVSRISDRFPLFGLSRPESASPATGSRGSHDLEQQWLLHRAFEMPLTHADRRSVHRSADIVEAAMARAGRSKEAADGR